MRIPLGDILRAFVKPDSFLGRILSAVRGTKVTTKGGTEILLDQKDGPGSGAPYAPGRSPFDSTPHKFEPPKFGPGPR